MAHPPLGLEVNVSLAPPPRPSPPLYPEILRMDHIVYGMTAREPRAVRCDHCGVTHVIPGRLVDEVMASIYRFREEHRCCQPTDPEER